MRTVDKKLAGQLFSPGTDREVDLTVYVYQRPHMRDASLDFELYMGRKVLDGIFDDYRMMPDVREVTLPFPENWLNIIEQRLLYRRLGYYCPNLKTVMIKTQSVYIIQCTCAQNLKIIHYDSPTPDESNADGTINLTGKTWQPMVGNVVNLDVLNQMHV